MMIDHGVSGLVLNVPAVSLRRRAIPHVLGPLLRFEGFSLTICPVTQAPRLCHFSCSPRLSSSWLPIRILLRIIGAPRQTFGAIISLVVYVRAVDGAGYLAHQPQPCVCGFSTSPTKTGGVQVRHPVMNGTDLPPGITGESRAKGSFKCIGKRRRPGRSHWVAQP